MLAGTVNAGAIHFHSQWTANDSDAKKSLAVRWILVLAAAAFVDDMRLLYTKQYSGRSKGDPNNLRFPEFVHMADEHLTDLSNQLARFVPNLDSGLVEKIRSIESSLRWLLTRLRHGPTTANIERYFPAARQISGEIDALCSSALVEGYDQAKEVVRSIGESLISSPYRIYREDLSNRTDAAPIGLFRLRLAIQSLFLEQAQESDELKIFTIADDRHLRFALPYFAVDHWILTRPIQETLDAVTSNRT